MLSEIMTQLLLLVTVLGAIGSLIAFVMVMPNRIKSTATELTAKMETTALELGNKIELLTASIDNLRKSHERLERENDALESRVRTIEHGRGAAR